MHLGSIQSWLWKKVGQIQIVYQPLWPLPIARNVGQFKTVVVPKSVFFKEEKP